MHKVGYITTEDEEEAKKIGDTLLQKKLISSVNYLGEIESSYWWNGEINNKEEFSLIINTSKKNEEEIIEKVKSIHSYENPCIIFFDITSGYGDYLDWIKKTVRNG